MKTINFLFTFLIILLFVDHISAQRKKKSPFIIGTSTGIEFLPSYTHTHRFSTTLGLFADFKTKEKFSFSPILTYSQRNFSSPSGSTKIELREDAITTQIVFKLNLKFKRLNYFIGFGPYITYSLRIVAKETSMINTFPFISSNYFTESRVGRNAGVSISSGLKIIIFKRLYLSPTLGWNQVFRGRSNSSISTNQKYLLITNQNILFLKIRIGRIF